MAFDNAWSDLSQTMDKVVDHWLGSFVLNVLAYSTVLIPLYVLVAYVKNHPNLVHKCELIIIICVCLTAMIVPAMNNFYLHI